MRPLRDQPIARKAVFLGLLPAVCALAIASIAFLVSTFYGMRRDTVDDLGTAAAMLADSVNVAVGFNDVETVRELANALRENTTIDRACVFDRTGKLVAGFARPDEMCPETFVATARLRRSQIAAIHAVTVGTRNVGTVRVVGNLRPLYRAMAIQATVTAFVLGGATVVSLLLIGRLQRIVTRPIAELAAAADRVSQTHDYSVRLEQRTSDEVGRLVESFNQMLAAVERSEALRDELLDRERQASRLKDEFLATVSHELRTPLNAILGWAQILTTTEPSPDVLEKGLKTLYRNAKVQTRLIEDLIEVSRIATGKLNLKLDVVDLRDVIRQSLEGLQAVASAKGVAMDVTLPGGPALVSGDRDRLQQIVSNVANNAVRFTGPGGRVSVSLTIEGADFILRVRDTGIGIAPEFLPHVFERFRQADASVTREHGGLGLGLAIVRELVHLHHGTVSAHSEGAGHGSEFVVRLPQLAEMPAGTSSVNRPEPAIRIPGVQVLAVDDHLDALEVLSAALSQAGADIRVAASGEEALRQWRSAPADVLICDLAMPGLDGFEVVRSIRELDDMQGRRAYAIALSAFTSPEYVERSQEAGFDAYVGKPFDPAKLVAQIAHATL